MKKLSISLILILMPVLVTASVGSPDSSAIADSALTVNRVYEVFGMDCPGCHGAVEKLVKKIPGVTDAKANWEEQKITIATEPGSDVNDEVIFDAIKRANFTPGARIENSGIED